MMSHSKDNPLGTKSPISRALGEDFNDLQKAVRRHYSEPTVYGSGVMESMYVNMLIRPMAWISYLLFRAPVPRGGEYVEFTLQSRVDTSGIMHWHRTFFVNSSFPRDVRFSSHMAYLGDHRIMEITRYGLGVESNVSVDEAGRLVYDIRKYLIMMPFLGLIVRFPTWVSPFGGGRTTETGENQDTFRVEFEMHHPIFGRTVSYTGTCQVRGRT